MEFEPASSGTRKIVVDGEYAAQVNIDPDVHPAGKALFALATKSGQPKGYVLRIRSELSPGKGLGNIAAKAEPAHHMDNACASAFGGFNIVARTPIEVRARSLLFPHPKISGWLF